MKVRITHDVPDKCRNDLAIANDGKVSKRLATRKEVLVQLDMIVDAGWEDVDILSEDVRRAASKATWSTDRVTETNER